jgi:hypothetical protein
MITLDYYTMEYTPYAYPYSAGRYIIAPYFASVDAVCGPYRVTGDVFYRMSTGKLIVIPFYSRISTAAARYIMDPSYLERV